MQQGFHNQISGKRNFFQVREKSGNFVAGQGNLERTLKIREFENKYRSYGRQSSKNLFMFKRGKDVLFHEIV